jgi:type I restriction enzyme S subunit
MVTTFNDDQLFDRIDLPDTWEVRALGDMISDIRPGFASGLHNEEGHGIPHLRPMNITLRGSISLDHLKYVETDSPLRAKSGDILFNNTNSFEHIGKSAVLDLQGSWAYSNHLTRLRLPESLIPAFVALQLRLLWRAGYFRLHARRHVNQVSIAVKQIKAMPLIVAPVEDQRHIISHVESRNRLLDDIESAISGAADRLTTYERHTIEAAATGTILQNAADQDVAGSWQMTTVTNVGEVQLGKMRSPASHSGPNMRPYLRVANVHENRIDITDVHEMNFSPTEFEKFKLVSGDVLLNEGQSPDLVGRPAMFRGEIDNCCFQKTLLRFRSNDGVSPTFALLVFRYYLHSGRFRQTARWSTNIAHLTAIRFGAMEFPLVSLVEQEVIAEEATRRLDIATELREMFDGILGRASIARDLVLAEAFHVELRPIAAVDIGDADREPSSEESGQEGKPMPTPTTGPSRGTRLALLEVLEQAGPLEAGTLFSQAGFTKSTVDDFYKELRDLVKSRLVVELRPSDGGINLRLAGSSQ